MTGKILVTGANGFVGQAVASCLHSNGRSVLGVCRRDTVMDFPTATVVSLDDGVALDELLKSVDAIVHCAARVHIMQDKDRDPLAAFRAANRDMTLSLARRAAAAGVRRFVFVSSIKVNGESTSGRGPFSPDESPSPEDPYGVSKLEAEQGLMALADTTNMDVVIVRPPLVYGPGVKGNFATMVRLVARGVPLPLGLVSNKRSLVALSNLVDLLIQCLDHPAAANEVFLVSDGEDLSTSELLRAIAREMGKAPRLLPVPVGLLLLGASLLGKKAVARRVLGSLQVDISKTTKLLGWRPPLRPSEGLAQVIRDSQSSL